MKVTITIEDAAAGDVVVRIDPPNLEGSPVTPALAAGRFFANLLEVDWKKKEEVRDEPTGD